MRRKTLPGAALLGGVTLSCAALSSGSGSGAAVTVEAGVPGRVPASHRAAGTPCPAGRGHGALNAACDYDGGGAPACLSDSDCMAGRSGRCLPTPGVACATTCSYDACSSDADCTDHPCACRESANDSAANVCLPGNCTVDGDCGTGGYCSPSGLPDACGLGYFCHTPNDACTDDADCPSSEGCSFDPHTLAWGCSVTCTRPP